jgi:glycosyltransferase involved in cell wall biosynthesis
MVSPITSQHKRIGFVSTRLAGTDGVSLETAKWANILGALHFECFFMAGEVDWSPQRTRLVPKAHFAHPEIEQINRLLLGVKTRTAETSHMVQQVKLQLKTEIESFVAEFKLNLLIVENALALPMNIPLGLALTEFLAESAFPVIAHHHDFSWERERFAVNAAADYLRTAFPPTLRSVHHVVINSFAGRQLALRTGESATLIPNVMDYDTPPPPPDDYTATFRSALGIAEDDCLLLQPTRVVPRKRIEHAISLAHGIGKKAVLVVSHAAGDEGMDYLSFLRNFAQGLGVRILFAGDRIQDQRGSTADGAPIFSLADAYYAADLVTYPSRIEGFGNAFLEAVYYRKPLVMSTYEIFDSDIHPKGFRVVGFDDFVGEATVRAARRLLEDKALVAEMVDHNYALARRYYSYRALAEHLIPLINDVWRNSNGVEMIA